MSPILQTVSKGFHPFLFLISTSHPNSISAYVLGDYPNSIAVSKGVFPSPSITSKSAPKPTKIPIISGYSKSTTLCMYPKGSFKKLNYLLLLFYSSRM